MSRLIVKNLPREIKEERLRSIFAEQGEITDIQLKYTRGGVFRRFAFIGFRTKKEAERAVKFYDKSFIDSSRLQVELAKDLGDTDLARPWSKYSEKSSAYQKAMDKIEEKKAAKELRKSKKEKATEAAKGNTSKEKKLSSFQELEAEPEFQEFVEAHIGRTQKAVWGNDVGLPNVAKQSSSSKSKVTDQQEEEEDDDSEEEEEEDSDDEVDMDVDKEHEEEEGEETDEEEEGKEKEANKTTLSDMDYLKSKIIKTKQSTTQEDDSSDSDSEDDDNSSSDSVSDSEDSEDSSGVEEDQQEEEKEDDMDSGKGTTSEEDDSDSSEDEIETNKRTSKQPQPADVRNEAESASGSEVKDATGSEEKGQSLMQKVQRGKRVSKGEFVVRMRGVPFKVQEKNIVEFFYPLEVKAIRVPVNDNGQAFGVAFAEFTCEKDVEKAMKRHKDYMGRRYIELFRDEKIDKSIETQQNKEPPWAKKAAELENSGDIIADTGRLFIRNFAYICREEDLESLFNTYGPLTEVNLPVDPLTKRIKGFAFITFMMPEHAVKAFTELDGTTFQGRLLHVLPGKEKKSEEEMAGGEGSSYKNKKKAKDKAMASSSHNWNSLFISANAVADAMAERYQTTKGQVLDADSNRSLAVRMALGETQIVAETRQFLLDNGVALDSFSQPSDKRSKTIILAKNLPASTKPDELRALFSKHGSLGRVILPPAGVTAIVEFIEATEARTAFYRLAYTKFQHVPLYLEWAPGNVFGEVPKQLQEDESADTNESKGDKPKGGSNVSSGSEQKKDNKAVAATPAADEEEEAEPGCTIFVKNLNFETTEETVKKKFSKCGPIKNATISRKKDSRHPGQLLSMGYGFVEFKKPESAKKAIKTLQHCKLDGHTLEIKVSNRGTLQNTSASSRKQVKNKKQTSTKILVRNIPFEASQTELKELFSTFGEIKAVRLPKKMAGTGRHRGFGFVDFLSKQDAKRAFDALCHSSHLYGRRLVLEWAETEESIDTLRQKTAQHFSEGGPAKKLKKSHLLDDLKSRSLDS